MADSDLDEAYNAVDSAMIAIEQRLAQSPSDDEKALRSAYSGLYALLGKIEANQLDIAAQKVRDASQRVRDILDSVGHGGLDLGNLKKVLAGIGISVSA